MDHRLLVAGLAVGQQGRVLELQAEQGFAEACDVAVAEDAEDAFDEAVFGAVALGVLDGEEADEGLGDGEAAGGAAVLAVCERPVLPVIRTPGFTRAAAVSTAAATSPSGG